MHSPTRYSGRACAEVHAPAQSFIASTCRKFTSVGIFGRAGFGKLIAALEVMRSSKPYSNVTFTKRVDREAGRHRAPKAPREPLHCPQCGAIYVKRRWIAGTRPGTAALAQDSEPKICPACEAAAKGFIRGHLRMEGSFLRTHRAEIEALLRNEASRAAEDNPTARIIRWEDGTKGELTIGTTTEHLTERLGHALHRAFGGEIDYGFSHENKFARAVWRRDEPVP